MPILPTSSTQEAQLFAHGQKKQKSERKTRDVLAKGMPMRISNAELTSKFIRALSKKIREIEALMERQAKGDELDAAQILKINSYDENVEKLKQAEGEADEVHPRPMRKGQKTHVGVAGAGAVDGDSENEYSEEASDVEEDDGEEESSDGEEEKEEEFSDDEEDEEIESESDMRKRQAQAAAAFAKKVSRNW